MGQLCWSQTHVLMADSHRLAKKNKICPNAKFLRPVITVISPSRTTVYGVIHRGSAYRGFFLLALIKQGCEHLHFALPPASLMIQGGRNHGIHFRGG